MPRKNRNEFDRKLAEAIEQAHRDLVAAEREVELARAKVDALEGIGGLREKVTRVGIPKS